MKKFTLIPKSKKVQLEDGSAHFYINLENGVVTVYHGKGSEILYRSKVKKGYWDNLWRAVKSINYALK